MVQAAGLEPAASRSQSGRAPNLRYAWIVSACGEGPTARMLGQATPSSNGVLRRTTPTQTADGGQNSVLTCMASSAAGGGPALIGRGRGRPERVFLLKWQWQKHGAEDGEQAVEHMCPPRRLRLSSKCLLSKIGAASSPFHRLPCVLSPAAGRPCGLLFQGWLRLAGLGFLALATCFALLLPRAIAAGCALGCAGVVGENVTQTKRHGK